MQRSVKCPRMCRSKRSETMYRDVSKHYRPSIKASAQLVKGVKKNGTKGSLSFANPLKYAQFVKEGVNDRYLDIIEEHWKEIYPQVPRPESKSGVQKYIRNHRYAVNKWWKAKGKDKVFNHKDEHAFDIAPA